MQQSLLKLMRMSTRLLGNIVKTLCYPVYWVFPKARFTIPKQAPAIINKSNTQTIPKIIWQTNYTNRVTLPVYINYLFNRLMSLDYEYRYHGDEDRLELIKTHGTAEQLQAFQALIDGASQADFWRLFVLNLYGGVYLDIDGQLIYPLSKIIPTSAKEVIVYRQTQGYTYDYTNYFIASSSNHELLQSCLAKIVANIQNQAVEQGVYNLTGPGVFNEVIEDEMPIYRRLAKLTCSQGTFTNEYFQYMDKKWGKWIYAKNEDLIAPQNSQKPENSE